MTFKQDDLVIITSRGEGQPRDSVGRAGFVSEVLRDQFDQAGPELYNVTLLRPDGKVEKTIEITYNHLDACSDDWLIEAKQKHDAKKANVEKKV